MPSKRLPLFSSWRRNVPREIEGSAERNTTSFLGYKLVARGFGGRHAPMMSPRQLKEVIQVVHTNVGSIATLGATGWWRGSSLIRTSYRPGGRKDARRLSPRARPGPTEGRFDTVAMRMTLVRR